MDNYTHKVAVIHQPFLEDIVLDEASARQAIEYIKQNRGSYLTEEAYQQHLKLYQDALLQFSVDSSTPTEE